MNTRTRALTHEMSEKKSEKAKEVLPEEINVYELDRKELAEKFPLWLEMKMAIADVDYDGVDRAMKRGANPGLFCNHALYWACRTTTAQIVERLLQDRRCDPSVSDNHPLASAIRNRRLPIALVLLEDPRVYAADRNGQPLYLAITNRDETAVRILLARDDVLEKVPDVLKELRDDEYERNYLIELCEKKHEKYAAKKHKTVKSAAKRSKQ